MTSTQAIRGMFLPLPTVFDGNGEVDDPMMRDLVEFYLEAGVHALFVCGSYGQGPAMRVDQRKHVAQQVVEQVRGRVPVVVHVGAVDPYTSIELGVHARSIGAEAIGSVGPYYYSDKTEHELILHFKMVDEAVQLPLMIYNNPAYQGYRITPEIMSRLVDEVPRIFGAKLAMGGLEEALGYIKAIPGFATFALANGLLQGMRLGITGTISPPLALAPELGVDLIRAIDEGRDEDANRLQASVSEINDLLIRQMREYGRTPYTEGMRALGFVIKQYPRWPTKPLPDHELESLLSLLKRVRAAPVA